MIVVDEVQSVLTSSDFRTQLRNIGSLMATNIPVTFLSATIPIRLQQRLKELILIPEEHQLIRANTGRPEHQYFLFKAPQHTFLDRAIAFVIILSQNFLKGTRRGIIFVQSKEIGGRLQDTFPQMDFINGDVKDSNVRLQAMKKWSQGQSGGWIIGTTSLIQGIDYHNIHLVVFVGAPFSMIDFVQGAGRAGRNGELSRVVVLHDGKVFYPTKGDREDLSCKREMADWLNKPRCRRMGISMCMDKEPHMCVSLQNAHPCDDCRPDGPMQYLWDTTKDYDIALASQKLGSKLTTCTLTSTSLEEPSKLEVLPLQLRLARPEVIKNSAAEILLVKSRLAKASKCINLLKAFSPNCPICYAESGGKKKTGKRHKLLQGCNIGEHFESFYDWNKPSSVRELNNQRDIVTKYNLLQGGWSYDSSVGPWCWACALPQKALKSQGSEHIFSVCPWSDIIISVAWSVWHNEQLFEEMKVTIPCSLLSGHKSKKPLEWLRWLVKQNDDRSGYNLHGLWIWYYEHVVDEKSRA